MSKNPEYKSLEETLKSRLYDHQMSGGRDVFDAVYTEVNRRKTGRNTKLWYAIAACFTLLVTTGVFFFYLEPEKNLPVAEIINTDEIDPIPVDTVKSSSHYTDTIKENPSSVENNTIPKAEVVKTNVNRIELISPKRNFTHKLPDGSVVFLDKGASVNYSSDFGNGNRNIRFKGKGFFEVEKNPDLPFVVETPKTTTTVTGTSFNLVSIPEKEEILVVSGSVIYYSKLSHSSASLKKGMQASVTGTKAEVVGLPAEDFNALAWRTGDLRFKNQKISEMLPLLEDIWQKEIIVENSAILECAFTGSFSGASENEIRQIMQLSLNVEWKETNNKIYISGIGCK